MAEFKRIIITKRGQALMAKLMSGRATLEFTKIGVSSTPYNDSQLENLTSLSNVKQEAQISNVTRNNDASVQVEGSVENTELTQGYYMETLGLYAKDPDEGEILYAVSNAQVSSYMPPFNNRTPSGAFFKLNVTIGNADNVTLQVDPAAVATVGDIRRLENNITNLEGFVGYSDDDILGLEVDYENNQFTRLAGAVGRTAGQAFDSFGMFGGRQRVNLSDDGTVNARFGDSGYVEDGSNAQVMVEQPKFYYRVVPLKTERIEDGEGLHLLKARYYVSDVPKSGFKVHPAFVREDGTVSDFVYLSAFEGSIYDSTNSTYKLLDEQDANFTSDKLSSVAKVKPASGVSQLLTRPNSRSLAQNRGEGWNLQTAATASLTQLLFMIEYGSLNMQEHLGDGVTGRESGEGNESELTGATSILGNESGEMENDSVSYRGEENFYGNIWTWVDGMNIKPQGIHKLYVSTHSFEDDTDQSPYEDVGFTIAKSNGYIKYFGYSEDFDWIFVPTETSGNSSVPVGDYLYQNSDSNADFLVARLGGTWTDGAGAGGFYWYLNYSSGYRSRNVGARLAYIPQ